MASFDSVTTDLAGVSTHRAERETVGAKQNNPAARAPSPPNIITSVTVFGPGQDAAQPTNMHPSPINATAPQRTLFEQISLRER